MAHRSKEFPMTRISRIGFRASLTTALVFVLTTITPLVALAGNGDPLGS